MSVEEWLIKWFVENTDASEKDIRSKIDSSYFTEGWIDSLKFINFICNIEDTFHIEFSNDEFQDRSFSTIQGISKIIERKSVK